MNSSAAAQAIVMSRSGIVARTWQAPATSPGAAFPAGRGSGVRMSAIAAAASTKVAASSSATTAPPNAVNSAAPASGATSRSPSRTVCRTALALASSSSGSRPASMADWPGRFSVYENP